MSIANKITIGIIGAGVIGNRLALVFSKIPEISIKYVCDIDKEKATVLANKYSATAISNYKDLIKDDSISAIYIGVPPSLHKDLAIEFLKAGKHVICEKPLALSVTDCQKMVTAKNNADVVTAVNLPFRYTLGVKKIQELLNQSYVGDIKKIALTFRFPIWPRAWQNVPWLGKKFQGGPLREVGTHFFFLVHELFGNVNKVFSVIKYPNSEDAETLATGILMLENHILVTVDLVVGSNEVEENSFTVIGSKGVLHFVDWYKLLGSQSEPTMNVLIDSENYTASSEYHMAIDFVKKILDKNSSVNLVSFEDALYAQKILESFYKSQESWIKLD